MSQDIRSRTTEARRAARLAEAEMRRDRLQALQKRQKRLTESYEAWEWISGWQDVIDRIHGPERDLLQPVSTANDRRYGDNWPFWRTWIEHSRLRAAARILCTLSNQARGLVGGLCCYVIKTGIQCRAAGRDEGTPKALVGAVQAAVEDFDAHNFFHETQQEIFARDRRDGESFTSFAPDDHGMLETVTFEPEHVGEPPALDLGTDKYGVITARGNTTQVQGFWVAHDGNFGAGEELSVEDVLHTKVNVDRAIKRGHPDFAYDCYDAIKSTSRLIEAMLEGGAIQASIPFIRQHEGSGADQVSEFQAALADYEQFNPQTSKIEKVERYYPGKIPDIPKGMNVVIPPFASNAAGFVTVAQAGYRSVAQVWNAPEWLASGDASNNNYASSLVAESPFVRRCEGAQEYYSGRFLRVYKAAIKARCDAGKLVADGRKWSWEEVNAQIKLTMEPPKLTVRDPLQEVQREQIEIQSGTNSPQAVCAEKGRDYEQIQADLEEHQARTGGGGMGLSADPAQMPDDDPFAELGGAGLDGAGAGKPADDANELRATVGGSQAIAELQRAVYAGELPREAAIANATIVFGFEQGQAEALFPEVAPTKTADDGGQDMGGFGGGFGGGVGGDNPDGFTEGYSGRKQDKRGRTRCYTDGKPTSCHTGTHSGGTPDRAHKVAAEHLRRLIDSPQSAQPDAVAKAAKAIGRLTVSEAKALRKSLGIEARGGKGQHAEAIATEAARAIDARDKWTREARKAGVDPKAMHQGAEEMVSQAREYQNKIRAMLAETRDLYKQETGKTLNQLHKAFRGGDHTDIPGFERIARTMAGRYPELLGAHGYGMLRDDESAAPPLYDYLHAGIPDVRKEDYYAEAIDVLRRQNDEVPF